MSCRDSRRSLPRLTDEELRGMDDRRRPRGSGRTRPFRSLSERGARRRTRQAAAVRRLDCAGSPRFPGSTFGANVFVATKGYETLVAAHDERSSGQQEMYLVLEGEADFELAGVQVRATRGTVIAVIDATVTRRAVACAPGTMLLAIGAGQGPFSSTWRESHFENVPRADEM
jgi:mannose-6-phosphate isomerase-like protein (cupin superfamily)